MSLDTALKDLTDALDDLDARLSKLESGGVAPSPTPVPASDTTLAALQKFASDLLSAVQTFVAAINPPPAS